MASDHRLAREHLDRQMHNLAAGIAGTNVMVTAMRSPGVRPLRLEDRARPAAMRDLARRIQRLPASGNKLRLGLELASKSTEGDFGLPTLQAAAKSFAIGGIPKSFVYDRSASLWDQSLRREIS